MLKKLVEAGFDPNAEEALGTAVEKGYEAISQYFMEKGATLEKSSPRTLVRLASKQGDQIAFLQRALAAGADVNFNEYEGRDLKGKRHN